MEECTRNLGRLEVVKIHTFHKFIVQNLNCHEIYTFKISQILNFAKVEKPKFDFFYFLVLQNCPNFWIDFVVDDSIIQENKQFKEKDAIPLKKVSVVEVTFIKRVFYSSEQIVPKVFK